MLLTVKKQVEETLEVKTPCYYKGAGGCFYFINENSHMVYVGSSLILTWQTSDGEPFNNEVRQMIQYGKPCTKEEFDKAYAETMAKFESAVGVINS